MTNSLSELSAAYEKSIIVQQEVIDRNREKLKKARDSFNFVEVERLQRLLRTLYDEKCELEECAYELKKYIS